MSGRRKMVNEFYFITNEVAFEETSNGAKILATVMELEKASSNGRWYLIEEATTIAKSLIGKFVFYGVDAFGRHCNPIMRKDGICSTKKPVGIVEETYHIGNRIKALIRITNKSLIGKLKDGMKFLFSVGGNAISKTIKKIGDKVINILHGARCNHLQIVDADTPVGFPSAQMEKVIEINETIMVCEGENCGKCAIVKSRGRAIDLVIYSETSSLQGVTVE